VRWSREGLCCMCDQDCKVEFCMKFLGLIAQPALERKLSSIFQIPFLCHVVSGTLRKNVSLDKSHVELP